MKRLYVLLLGLLMCFSLVACGSNNGADNNDSQTNEDLNDKNEIIEQIVTMEELYGVYESSLDAQYTFLFTNEEHTRDENNTILTTPVYFCHGEDVTPSGVYSFELEGDILTVVTWFGEEIPYKVIKEDGKIQLQFMKDVYTFSLFDMPSPNNQAFLSDLRKLEIE